MNTSSYPRLLGDVGGTNARLAWQDSPHGPLSEVVTYPGAEHASLQSVIELYLADHGKAPPAACAIGIATAITGDRVQMTNHHWSFSISELQKGVGLPRLKVINDFTALALSLPALAPTDLHRIGPGEVVTGAPVAVLGAGTGLGVSGLVPAGAGAYVPINGEGGHVTLPAQGEHEAAVVLMLDQRFGHASAERALSGPGLVNLYNAICELEGRTALKLGPADVISRARVECDAQCIATIDLFCSFLGNVAGNLALTLGARGGVYIGGGIAPRLHAELARSSFRERFEGKGRYRSYLSGIATFIIDAEVSPALIGASRSLDLPE